MRKTSIVLAFILPLLACFSCVKPKIYRAELSKRQQSEAREVVLMKELSDRKKETGELTKQLGELNRTIGNQEVEIRDLRAGLAARTQQMGESASKLATEIISLQQELADRNTELSQRNTVLQRVLSTQQKRKNIVADLKAILEKGYPPTTGVKLEIQEETLLLTLPDKSLFDPVSGLTVTGKPMLTPLAELLLTRPELDIDIVAHTDNVLPKNNKTLVDTWDWSLARATHVARFLIREFNVNANQLTPVGRGEFYPSASNETPEGRAQNRRTVIVIHPVLPTVPAAE